MPDPARRLGRELDGEIEPDGTRMRALLAAVVEGSDDGIFAKDLHGTILTWNRGAERIYGYTPHEIVGANVSILFPPRWKTTSRRSWRGSAGGRPSSSTRPGAWRRTVAGSTWP